MYSMVMTLSALFVWVFWDMLADPAPALALRTG